jgi:hypothetical protein
MVHENRKSGRRQNPNAGMQYSRANKARPRAAGIPPLQSPDSQLRPTGGRRCRPADRRGHGMASTYQKRRCRDRAHERRNIRNDHRRQLDGILRRSSIRQFFKIMTARVRLFGIPAAILTATGVFRNGMPSKIQKADAEMRSRRRNHDSHAEQQQGCQQFSHRTKGHGCGSTGSRVYSPAKERRPYCRLFVP